MAGLGSNGDVVIDEEPFGTTPLPTNLDSNNINTSAAASVKLNFHPTDFTGATYYQQPQTTQLAVYEATSNEECLNGSLVDVNQHFVVYAVKNGLIRVLHRHSTMRALLRGHAGQIVTDIKFFMDGDVLGTVGSKSGGGSSGATNSSSSSLIIWRVFENSPNISHEKLLEIHTPDATLLTMTRLVWHPFNPNQFWMLHDNYGDAVDNSDDDDNNNNNNSTATLVETTRIQTRVGDEGNAICTWHSSTCVMEGALQLKDEDFPYTSSSNNQLTDLAWSGRDTRHVLSCNKDGRIILWDLRQKSTSSAAARGRRLDDGEMAAAGGSGNDVTVPKQLCVIEEEGTEWSRICLLPHETSTTLYGGSDGSSTNINLTTCFVTASSRNSVLTLWSGFTMPSSASAPATASTPVVPPVKLQVISLASNPSPDPFSFVVDVCYGPAPSNAAPPSTFLLVGPKQSPPPTSNGGGSSSPLLHAFHIRSQWNETKSKVLLVGTDYVVPFSIKHPIYSWSVVCAPTQDIAATEDEDAARTGSSSSLVVNENGDTVAASEGFAASSLSFDIKLFSYQSKAVQTLTLTPYMLLPPEHAFPQDYQQKGLPRGIVSVEPLTGKYTLSSMSNGSNQGIDDDAPVIVTSFDEEEYDVEDDEDDDQVGEAPAASSLPVLGGGTGPMAAGNPFANWLGAIANTGNPPPPPAPAADALPVPPPAPPSTPATGMLPPKSIMEVDVLPPLPPGLGGQAAAAAASNATSAALASNNGSSSYLNPMEFLKSLGGGGGGEIDESSSNNNKNNAKSEARSQTPSKGGKGKGRGKSPKRSKSPKNKKQQQQQAGDAAKAPFPDGKVKILKRDDITAVSSTPAPPLPPDPSVLNDPAMLAAAGIPVGGTDMILPPPLPLPMTASATIDHGMLEASVNKAVEEAMIRTMIPAVNKAVQESFAALARPLRSSMDNLSKQGVSVDANDLKAVLDVETPLKAAMAENMRHVLVPALESISSQVLQQVQASMPTPPPDNTKTLTALAQQLGAMTSKLDNLTNEVQALRKQASEQAARAQSAPPVHARAGGASVPPPPDPMALQMEQTRQEIKQLIAQGNYEAAFTKAVSVTSTDITLFACRNSNINKVLGAATPALSQPILLCLMQQLGAALATTTDPNDLLMIVSWLQELALSLNPSDAKIKNHIPGVVQQLVTNINAKAVAEHQQGTNPQLRRPLQMLMQVLRGMLMG